MWMLDLAHIDDVRNGLLLFKPIEWAFDTSQLCFKLDPFNDFVPHLLNNNLKEMKLIDKLRELCAEVGVGKAGHSCHWMSWLSAYCCWRAADNAVHLGICFVHYAACSVFTTNAA
jgi:hypothetical protein